MSDVESHVFETELKTKLKRKTKSPSKEVPQRIEFLDLGFKLDEIFV